MIGGMEPLDLLPGFAIVPGTPAADRALAWGLSTFRQAAGAVWRLPYGRNTNRADPLLVLEEGRGTCSTRHAFLALLAREHRVSLDLMLGVYLMDAQNTPGAGAILEAAGLTAIPEAHCYLRVAGARIDLTHPPGRLPGSPITAFLAEEAIEPEQIGAYKTEYHRRFLAQWLARPGAPALTLDELWAVREACIPRPRRYRLAEPAEPHRRVVPVELGQFAFVGNVQHQQLPVAREVLAVRLEPELRGRAV